MVRKEEESSGAVVEENVWRGLRQGRRRREKEEEAGRTGTHGRSQGFVVELHRVDLEDVGEELDDISALCDSRALKVVGNGKMFLEIVR